MTATAATAAAEGKRARVLIVDDLPANLGVLLTCLDDAGYKVLVAAGGDKVLEQLVRPLPGGLASENPRGQRRPGQRS